MAAIAGLNPYKTPLQVYMEKLGYAEGTPDNPSMAWGRILEPVIVKAYRDATGKVVKYNAEPELKTHPKYPFLIGHLDGEILNGNDLPIGVFEAKTAGSNMAKHFGESGSVQIPEMYLVQVQHYMMITGLSFSDVAALIGGNDFRIYHIERDMEIWKYLLSIGTEFWRKNVMERVPPPVDGSDAAKELLKRLYPKDTGEVIELNSDDPLIETIENLRTSRDNIDRFDAIKQKAENQIKERMGEASILKVPGVAQITWKQDKEKSVIDFKAIVDHLAVKQATIDKFTAVKAGSRRFLTKFIEENNNG